MTATQQDISNIPLAAIDVSDATLYQQDTWRPYFERLRAEDPVHWSENDTFGGFWSVTRFQDITAVDGNHEAFSSVPAITIGDYGDDLPVTQFIAMDPPIHDVQRAAVQGVVAPKNLSGLESLIRQRVGNILDELPVGETFNWVEKVSINLTTQMLATIFDFPFEDRHKLPYWSDMATSLPEIAGSDGDGDERTAALQDCLAYFTVLWHQRKHNSPDTMDLVSLLATNPHTRDMVEDPLEYLGNLLLLIIGGNDTTRNSITGGVLALNQNPAEYAKLKTNPSLIPSMVSEIIRWQTPLMHMRRIATRDIELGGKMIRKGEKVVMWYLSGNHDETAIERPDEFIIDRTNPRYHLSFGFGVHRCMGNRLGEMQLRILWEEVLQRFSHVEVVGEPERVLSNFVRGYSSLPVLLHA
ncbi:cytochrome P450 [Luminiphilus sp.]|jgi:cytochrome P450|nr:cytochrome P450 [Luminiphilus sp.]